MSRRRVFFLALLILAALIGVVTWLVGPATAQITLVNASRIKPDMTLPEVEAILGGPARNEMDPRGEEWGGSPHIWVRTSALWKVKYRFLRREGWTEPTCRQWSTAACRVTVFVDPAGRVRDVFADPTTISTEFGLFFLQK